MCAILCINTAEGGGCSRRALRGMIWQARVGLFYLVDRVSGE